MPQINPDPPGSPSFRPQIPVRLSDLRQIAEQSRQMMRSASTGDLDDVGAGMGYQHGAELVPVGFFARLTAYPVSSSQPWYSFVEVQDDDTGKNWTTPNGAVIVPYAAMEASTPTNLNIDVPGAPTLSISGGGSPTSTTIYYVVTATWQDAYGDTYQGPLSNEASATAGGAIVLTWTQPGYSLRQLPSSWPGATVPEWTITGYQIWAGTVSGQQTRLVASVSNATFTYTDNGNGAGTVQSPVLGGTAGPVVWMSPRSAWSYYKFFFPPKALLSAWLRVTTSTPSTVTLPPDSGGSSATIQAYTAELDSWNNTTGNWGADLSSVWFYGANSEAPQPLKRYEGWLIGLDSTGRPIFSAVPGAVLAIINSATPNAQGFYDATIRYYNGSAWANGPNIWLIDGNG